MKYLNLLFCLLFTSSLISQEEFKILETASGNLHGTLLMPVSEPGSEKKVPLVLIIAGSGPTDRDGNNMGLLNNSLKLLAEELQKNGIASFRYDKRGVGESSDVDKNEYNMRPDTFVQDVKGWITFLSQDKRFNKLIVAGHSEGSLFGMLASINNPNVHAYISIAGAGRTIDVILKEQFSNIAEEPKKTIYGMLDQLKKGDTISNVPPILYTIFRPSIQPYMISWMQYDPQEEIKKLTVPILITSGTTDIQVKVLDAQLLAKAQPKAQLKIIKNMNHVLKDCDTLDKALQQPIYENPSLPLNKEFSKSIVKFISVNFITAKQTTSPKPKK